MQRIKCGSGSFAFGAHRPLLKSDRHGLRESKFKAGSIRQFVKSFFKHRPTVGPFAHLAPSGEPPLGQNAETSVSLASQLTAPSACTDRSPVSPASPLSPLSPF